MVIIIYPMNMNNVHMMNVPTRLEDFSNRLNLRHVKRRMAVTPPTPTSVHFDAPKAMLPVLPSL